MSRSRTTSASAAPTARWCSVASDSAECSGSPEPEPPPASGSTPDAGAEPLLSLNVGLDRFGALGLLLLSLIPPGVLLVWLLLHLTAHPADRALTGRLTLFGLSLLLSLVAQRYRRQLRDTCWQLQLPDRQSGWSLNRPGDTPHPGRPEVMIDLDRWMLLRWRPAHDGHAVWLTLSRLDHRPHWHRLRCALFSTAPEALKRPQPPSSG